MQISCSVQSLTPIQSVKHLLAWSSNDSHLCCSDTNELTGSKINKENETSEQVDGLLMLRAQQKAACIPPVLGRTGGIIQPVVEVSVNLPWAPAAKPPGHVQEIRISSSSCPGLVSPLKLSRRYPEEH